VAAKSANVIREFLVALGFSVDKDGLKKFKSTLEGSAKLSKELGVAIGGVATAVEGMVAVFASRMEKMYYASKRTDASVKNLQALQFGFGQIGLSADDALGAIEGMAAGLRTNPGLQALLRNLGVADNKDPTVQFKGLMRRLVQMPYQIGVLWAKEFGISENLFKMLSLPGALDKLDEAEARNRELYRKLGVDQEKSAEDAKNYMNTLRDIWGQVEVLFAGFLTRMMPHFQKLATWVSGTLPELTAGMSEFLDDLFSIDDIDLDPKYIAGFFDEMINREGPLKGFRDVVREIVQVIKDLVANTKELAQHPLDYIWEKMTGRPSAAARSSNYAREQLAAQGENQDTRARAVLPPALPTGVAKAPSGSAPLGVRQNNPGNLRAWGKALVRNGFAAFSSKEEGLSAMAGNLNAYAKQGLTSVEQIVSKWAPSNENNTAAYIAAVSKNLGVNAADRLNLSDAQTMAAVMGAIIKHEQGYAPYSSADILAAARSRTEGAELSGGVTLNQETNITVNGAADARGTAATVAGLQGRVNGDIVRNLSVQTR
jgi:hypothetical protein